MQRASKSGKLPECHNVTVGFGVIITFSRDQIIPSSRTLNLLYRVSASIASRLNCMCEGSYGHLLS